MAHYALRLGGRVHVYEPPNEFGEIRVREVLDNLCLRKEFLCSIDKGNRLV